jgi:putative Mn2+ efflux pump MntP
MLLFGLLCGDFIGEYIAPSATKCVCMGVLVFLGLYKISEVFFENKKSVSRNLTKRQAFVMALALSLDGLAAGVGKGLLQLSLPLYVLTAVMSLVMGLTFLLSGAALGNKIAGKFKLNLGIFAGLILIILGIIQMF